MSNRLTNSYDRFVFLEDGKISIDCQCFNCLNGSSTEKHRNYIRKLENALQERYDTIGFFNTDFSVVELVGPDGEPTPQIVSKISF